MMGKIGGHCCTTTSVVRADQRSGGGQGIAGHPEATDDVLSPVRSPFYRRAVMGRDASHAHRTSTRGHV